MPNGINAFVGTAPVSSLPIDRDLKPGKALVRGAYFKVGGFEDNAEIEAFFFGLVSQKIFRSKAPVLLVGYGGKYNFAGKTFPILGKGQQSGYCPQRGPLSYPVSLDHKSCPRSLLLRKGLSCLPPLRCRGDHSEGF